MEINNILVSTSREGYYSINFDIVGENVNVYLSIDNEEYQEIFTNQSTSSLNYGDILSTGGHTAKLKISNELEEIESDEFDIFIKPIPTLNNVKVEQSLSDGTFIISYTLSGYSEDKFSVSYQVDENPFVISIGDNIQIGNNIFNGNGLSLGIHTLRLTATYEDNNANYLLVSDDIEIEVKVLPKLENITYKGSNTGEYEISFDIIGDINHTYKIELKINNNKYITLLDNLNNGSENYKGVDMPRGINICKLKVSDGKDYYESNSFNIIIKEKPNIQNIKQTDSNSKGEYKITFDVICDSLFSYNIQLKIDDNNYKTIMQSQTGGTKVYSGDGLSLGKHTGKLKISDSIDSVVVNFDLDIVNKVPNLSIVLTSNEDEHGNYILNYATKDVETDLLTHYLSIDNSSYSQIEVIKNENFFTYNGKNLTVGVHKGNIKVSDGLDEVISQTFTIEIPYSGSTSKQKLAISKRKYDNTFNQFTNCITSIIADGIFDASLENPLMEKALENYKNAYTDFNKISQTSIDIIGTNKVDDAKESLKNSIDGISGSINDLEDAMYGVFADGLLSDAEKETINKQLNLISKEKVDIDTDYKALYTNRDLIDPYKTSLKNAYTDFVNKHNTLIKTISDMVEKEEIVDEDDRTKVNTAFDNWRKSIGTYKEQSLIAIDSIAQKKVNDSADVINKKWADIILDPENGIQSIVGNLQESINGKGGISERLQTAEQKITADAITQIVKDVSYTKEEVDNIEIGGRNLIRDSYINKTSSEYGFSNKKIYALEPNTQYTLSMRGYCSQTALDNDVILSASIYDSDWYWSESLSIDSPVLVTKSKTFTTPEVINGGVAKITFYAMDNRLNDNNVNNTVTVLWVKLEKGNKATDWTQAQEDVEETMSKIEQKADSITLTVSNMKVGGNNILPDSYMEKTSSKYGFGYREIYDLEPNTDYVFTMKGCCSETAVTNGIYLKATLYTTDWSWDKSVNIYSTDFDTVSKVFTTPTTIPNGYIALSFYAMDNRTTEDENNTVTVLWAKLEQGNVPTDWTPALEDTEKRFSEIEQTAESIATTVKNIKVGGSNLLKDSYIDTTNYEYGFKYRYITLEPNTEYTWSVRGCCSQTALANGVGLMACIFNEDWSFNKTIYIETTEMTTESKTFTTPETLTDPNMTVCFYADGNDTNDANNTVTVLWTKLEKGNIPTDWFSSQDDIDEEFSRIEQTANMIKWIVESGDSSASMTLTDDALDIIAKNIRINGDIIMDGTIYGQKINARNLNVVNDDGVTTLSISSNGDVAEMKIKNLMIMAQDGEYQNLTSMINQSVSAVEMKFVESNGYNKIHNSSFRNDFEYWSLLSWNRVGQMASAGAKYNWEIREAGNEWALLNRNVLSVYAYSLTGNTTEGLGVGVDSERIWGGIDWTFSCLLAWHRTTGVHMEILEYDSSGSRLSNFNTDLFTTSGMHSGGNDRNNWYRVNKKFTLKNSNCAYFIIRLYMSKWDGQQNTAYLFLAEPQVVLGHKDVAYTLSSDEFYSGLVRADMNGLTVHMSNGEGAQGYSRLAYDGLSIYDSKGNRRAWFGDDDSAYIQNLSVDSISCPQIVKNCTISGRPSNFYVKAGSSGNGTSTGDYAGSINAVLNYIKNTWGVYSYAQDLSIYISPGSYSEDVFIAGWIGSGVIRLTFDSGATLYGSIKIEECTMYTVIDGGKEKYGWDANAGAIIEQRNEGRAIEFRNSNGLVMGFRSRAGGGYYSSTFVKVGRGSDVMVYYNDVVGYVSVVSVSNNGVARCVDNRGDATYVADGQVSTLLLYGAIPMLTTNTNIRNDWACHKEDKSGSQTNSVWIPKANEPEPTPPPPPPATWKWFSQTFIVSNLRSVPEGSGSVTSSIANCMAQGNWSSYKAHRGYGDLGNSPSSWCSGGRNFTITCTMHRKNSSHGYAGAVPHPVFIHTDGSSWDCGVTFARNDTKTFTFPPSIANAIVNGSMKTLQIWAGRSTTQYSHYDSVSITITCEKQV